MIFPAPGYVLATELALRIVVQAMDKTRRLIGLPGAVTCRPSLLCPVIKGKHWSIMYRISDDSGTANTHMSTLDEDCTAMLRQASL